MIYDFSYESSSGDLFEFGSESLWPEDDQFRSMEYSTVSSGHRILGFYRSITKFTVPVTVHSDSEADAVAKCNKLMAIGAIDRGRLTPGTLRCGPYKAQGYITAVEFDASNDVYGLVTNAKLTIVMEDPTWTMEETRSFIKNKLNSESIDSEWLDYPRDFPYDYMHIDHSWQAISNPGPLPCPPRITIYGFAENPTVRIGANTYQVNTTVPIGSRLVIDSRSKEVYEISRTGAVTNKLDKRRRGAKGEGAYVFEKVPVGRSLVTFDGSFGFDVTLIHESEMPPFYTKGV